MRYVEQTMSDLIVLTADLDMENAMKGILGRHQSLAIREISADIVSHPQHDPGCAIRGVDFLSRYAHQYNHGLLMFDHEGSGREQIDRQQLQKDLDAEFAHPPWEGRARAIVIKPELETWIWSDSPEVDRVLGWSNRATTLRAWLSEQDWVQDGSVKPDRPKEAFLAALRKTRTARSASLYRQIAERVSLSRCRDPAFLELKAVLQQWFQDQEPHRV